METAIADLEEIYAYLNEANPQAAESICQGIYSHIEKLKTFPKIGHPYPLHEKFLDAPDSIRELVYRQYRIFYRLDMANNCVELWHIRHGARLDLTEWVK